MATGLEALRGDLMSRHHYWCRDVGANKGGRDMERDVATWLSSSRLELMSRHHVDVATWATARDVATWKSDVVT